MYELLDINPKVITTFFKVIEDIYEKENFDSLLLVAIRQTFHNLYPELPMYVLDASVKKSLQPIIERKRLDIHTRDFKDRAEPFQLYYDTYAAFTKELRISQTIEDKYTLQLIDYSINLLPYDKVTVIDGVKILASFIDLTYWGERHSKAFENLKALYDAKPDEGNIDTATNTNKGIKDRVRFLTDRLRIPISNPNVDSSEEEIQAKLLETYGDEHRMIARSIYLCSQIPKDIPEFLPTKAIGKLEPYINSDGEITKKDLYISWYAYAVGIYKRLSGQQVPIDKALELARLSSYVVFPELRSIKSPVVSIEIANKPIRERALFNGLRLHDFSDGRLRITRTQDEIDYTEEYLEEIIKQLYRLS